MVPHPAYSCLRVCQDLSIESRLHFYILSYHLILWRLANWRRQVFWRRLTVLTNLPAPTSSYIFIKMDRSSYRWQLPIVCALWCLAVRLSTILSQFCFNFDTLCLQKQYKWYLMHVKRWTQFSQFLQQMPPLCNPPAISNLVSTPTCLLTKHSLHCQ